MSTRKRQVSSIKTIGILTGGGDCPGLNAAIRAVVKQAYHRHQIQSIGFKEGFKGLYEGNFKELSYRNVSGILSLGGTILGTSRFNPLKTADGMSTIKKNLSGLGIDLLVCIGGEGTMRLAYKLHQSGVKVFGIPKTIDNDIYGTDYTFGFSSAVHIAAEAMDRLHTTAESHNRVMIAEVMGRHTGWIATYAGLAAGADVILIPEFAYPLEKIIGIIEARKKVGKKFTIICISEDAKILLANKRLLKTPLNKDEYGTVKLGGISHLLAHELEKHISDEIRVTQLAYLQRGGSPTMDDRVLATRLGCFSADEIARGQHGKMAAIRGNKILSIPLAQVVKKIKTVPKEIYELADTFSV